MAGEDRAYTSWLHSQPCARCGVTYGIQVHHPLWATTYSPEERKPAKAIAGAKKGKSQRSHDHFALPLCLKCHEPGIHRGLGSFAGTTSEEREGWERKQIPIHRNRYAMQAPAPVPREPDSSPDVQAFISADAAAERRRNVAFLRREAAQSHRSADASAALNDVADVLEGRAF